MEPNRERRYGAAEIEEIFARAAEESEAGPTSDVGSPPTRGDGLTLAQLQEVGAEVGLPPERVAEAAAAIARPEDAERVDSYGHPTRVVRAVELPRAPTDREWEQLVAGVREEIGRRGRVESRGEAREWSDGAFHLYVEPSDTGTRLRMTEERRVPFLMPAVGAFALLDGIVLLVTRGLDAATFGPLLEWLLPVVLVLAGGAAVTTSLVQARSWAADREVRMGQIAERARRLLAGPEVGGDR